MINGHGGDRETGKVLGLYFSVYIVKITSDFSRIAMCNMGKASYVFN